MARRMRWRHQSGLDRRNNDKIVDQDGTTYTEGMLPNAVHQYALRNWVKSNVCSVCGRNTKTDWSYKRHPKPYTRNREDYREVCHSCHMAEDRTGKPTNPVAIPRLRRELFEELEEE